MNSLVSRIKNLISSLGGLKTLERYRDTVFWRDYPFPKRYDSVADHTWRLAMMVALVEPHLSKPMDFRKAMLMALFHDVPELKVGDASPLGSDGTGKDSHAYHKDMAREKFLKEHAALKEILTDLPDAQKEELESLWLEMENKNSFEARVVQALDKIEGKMQVFEWSKGEVHKEYLAFLLKYRNELFSVDPFIQELADGAHGDFEKNFKEFKKKS